TIYDAHPLEIFGFLEPGKYPIAVGFHIEDTLLSIFKREPELPVVLGLDGRNVRREGAFGNNFTFHSSYVKGSIIKVYSLVLKFSLIWMLPGIKKRLNSNMLLSGFYVIEHSNVFGQYRPLNSWFSSSQWG